MQERIHGPSAEVTAKFAELYNVSTPLVDAVQAHIYRQTASFHTPGHKGNAALLKTLADLSADLTELPDTGSLYDGGDAIEAAEIQAAQAFGAGQTFFSGGGCTLCIQAMLLTGAGAGARVLMARNAHRSAVHAAALLGLDVCWLWPETTEGGFQQPTVENVKKALETDQTIQAVYITSPDYNGNLCDVEGMAVLCRERGIPLLVDNAHGSHLGAFGRHPLQLGAAMSADSAHKTLPVLTGGAYWHTADWFPVERAEAKAAMALFGSTSPAFPVLASLDAAQAWWRTQGADAYRRLAEDVEAWRALAQRSGVVAPAFAGREERLRDPARLTLDSAPGGIGGQALAAYFRERGCEPEHADDRYVVLIPTPFTGPEERERLTAALEGLATATFTRCEQRAAFSPAAGGRPERVLSIREATLLPTRTVPVEEAGGRVAARTVCPCPPGVAAVVPGERLSDALVSGLKNCGFSQVVVVKTL